MKFGGNLDLCYKELQNAVLHNVTSDIDNPLAGQIWYRSDSGEFVFYGKRGREVFISELYLFHTLIPLMDNTYSQIGHSHNLEDLDERSYYSLLDTPGDWDALDAVRGINTGDETAESIIDKIGTDGQIKSDYLPSYVDDVIEGYYFGAAFYSDSAHTELITAEQGKIYVDIPTNFSYRYSGSAYINISNPLDYSTNIEADKASTTKVSAIKTLYDWATGKFIALSKLVTSWSGTPSYENIPSEKLVYDDLAELDTNKIEYNTVINSLDTEDKTLNGAINEINAIAKGRMSYAVTRDINGNVVTVTYASGRIVTITRAAGLITKYEDAVCEYVVNRTGVTFDGITVNNK